MPSGFVPDASEQVTKSQVAHKWAQWLQNPCRLGIDHASERGTRLEEAPKSAEWLHDPCHLGHCRCFKAREKIKSGRQVGPVAKQPLPYGGVPNAPERGGGGSQVAHKWAGWLQNACRVGGSRSFTAGRKINGGPKVGALIRQRLPYGGVLDASERGTKSKVAHKGAQ